MRQCSALFVLLALVSGLATALVAGEFKLEDGETIHGTPSGSDDYGVTFKLDSGPFSQRVSWGKFTQDSLKELVKDPRLRPMVEPFIEIPPEAKPKPKPIIVKDPPRVERPIGKTTFFSSATTPVGLLIFGILYLANLFAAYEIAIYRLRPPALVCGLSALLPVLGPLIFMASPTLEPGAAEADPAVGTAVAPGVAAAGSPAGATSRQVVSAPATPAAGGGGLRVAADGAAAGGKVQTKVYNRNDYMFNRRFIETQFSGFFRVVPTDAEKDLVLLVKTPKNDFLAKRISRISANEMFLQLVAGKEVNVSFGEIAQITVCDKDDPAAK